MFGFVCFPPPPTAAEGKVWAEFVGDQHLIDLDVEKYVDDDGDPMAVGSWVLLAPKCSGCSGTWCFWSCGMSLHSTCCLH